MIEIDREDAAFLKRELLFRMAVQNAVIVINATVFLMTLYLQLLNERFPAQIGLGFALFACIAGAIWCHHGARQAQIKTYLLLLQAKYNQDQGWEGWLPRNGFTGLLGSRWFISTKATFICSVAAVCANGLYLDHSSEGIAMSALALIVLGCLTILLLTNPKERLAEP